VHDNKFCSNCSYPLTPQAYEEIKAQEDTKLREMEVKQKQDIEKIREEMTQQFNKIMSLIQQNPILSQVKLEALTTKELL
jgi:integrase/recombinase XerD